MLQRSSKLSNNLAKAIQSIINTSIKDSQGSKYMPLLLKSLKSNCDIILIMLNSGLWLYPIACELFLFFGSGFTSTRACLKVYSFPMTKAYFHQVIGIFRISTAPLRLMLGEILCLVRSE